MAQIVGALSVDLRANSAAFSKDMGKASAALNSSRAKMNRSLGAMDKAFGRVTKSLKRTVGSIFNLRGAIGGMVAAVGVAGLGLMITRSIAAADSIGKVADKVGLTTDELQEMRFAADQTGVAITALDMGMQRFSRRVGEAALGTGELKDTLNRLGIQLHDDQGSLRSVMDILGDYADEVQNATSEQDQLLLAFKGFDSEGAALVNLLRQGKEGIEKFRDQAQSLGLVLDERMVRAAERANDQLSIMRQIIGVNLTSLMISLAPTIIRVGQAFQTWAPAIQAALGRIFPLMFASVDELERRIAEVQASIDSELADQAEGKTTLHFLTPNLEEKRADLAALQAALANATESAEMLEIAFAAMGDGGTPGEESPATKVIAELKDRFAAMARTAEEQRRFTALQRAGNEATADEIWLIEQYLRVIAEREAQTRRLAEEEKARQEQARAAAAAEEALFNQMQDAIAKTNEQIASQQAVIDQWKDGVEDALTSVIMRTKSAKDAFKQLALAIIEAGIRRAVVGPIVDAVFGAFGGGLAAGGAVAGGTSYLVGERGPELFTPGRTGVITPNNDLGGGGGTVINVDARGAEIGVERRVMQAISDLSSTIEPRSIAAVSGEVQRGGSTARLFRGQS